MTAFAGILAAQARARPDAVAVVDAGPDDRVTYAELDALVDRAAGHLGGTLGVRPGEVVTSQLPNGLDAVVVAFAVDRVGAVHNPVGTILGGRELEFVLAQAASPVVVVPAAPFRGTDHASVAADVATRVPTVRHVVPGVPGVPGGASPSPSPLRSGGGKARHSAPFHPQNERGGRPAVLLYTSGTTSDPKGVLHTHATLVTECRAMASFYGLGPDDVTVVPSPVSHVSGLLYGVLVPVLVGATAVLMDRWDPTEFLALVERERGTFSAGATPFLQGVVDHPDLDRFDHSSLRCFPSGGAGVPPDLVRRAIARLGVRTGRGYGSTEFPSITSSAGPDEPDERRATTDGRPIGPNRVEVRRPDDPASGPLGPGVEGEIWAAGPERFVGYLDPSLDAEAIDAGGWFRTGDLGVVDAEGYLTVTGRVKEVVLRGGETFSAKEVEDLLAEHEGVREVAVVPVPDPALGERACAVVVPRRPAAAPTLADLTAHLAARRLSRRKWPERLVTVDVLPRTASGKVQKHLLAQRVAAMLDAEGTA